MRNFKRTLALVLAVIMVMGTFATVSAADAWYKPGVDYIEGIGVDIIGNKADQKITRNDFVLWIAKIESHQMSTKAWDEEVANVTFEDVTDEHHKAAIAYAHTAQFIEGKDSTHFDPDAVLTLGEASAIFVRLMGYENKVDENPDEQYHWALNWMRAANINCHAYTDTFYQKTDTFNPDWELSYGEAAYLLATIMNAFTVDVGGDGIENDKILTADGIDLGDFFSYNTNLGVSGKAFYLVGVEAARLAGTYKINEKANVTLVAADGSGDVYTMSAKKLLKYVRNSLGLSDNADESQEETEINIYDYVNDGSVVNVVLNKSDIVNGKIDNAISSFNVTGSVIYNTLLQLKASTDATKLGWTSASTATKADGTPVTPATYTEDLAIVWNSNKSAFTFKGTSYKLSSLPVYDATLPVDATTGFYPEVANANKTSKILSAVEGQCYLVFNDVNGDGKFDNVVAHEADAFNADAYSISVKDGKVIATITISADDDIRDLFADNVKYKDVEVGALTSGIISIVDAHRTIGGIYAQIKNVDGTTKDVTIPTTDKKVSVSVNIGGTTKTVSYETNIGTFLGEIAKKIVDAGITSTAGVTADQLAAWMAGKYVSYYADAKGNVIAIELAETDGISGFVTKVEKTETGDNTYNVTIATTGKKSTVSATTYLTAVEQNIISTSTDADGNLLDAKGNKFTDVVTYNTQVGVSTKTIVEVRASASGIFDWANYTLYQNLFTKGSLISTNAVNGPVVPGTDLVYVTVVNNEGGLSYLKAGAATIETPAQKDDNKGTYTYVDGTTSKSGSYLYTTIYNTIAQARNSWNPVNSYATAGIGTDGKWTAGNGVILSIKETGSAPDKTTVGAEKYTAIYDIIYGYDPFYLRTYNTTKKAYEYKLYFNTVVTLAGVSGVRNAIVDVAKCYIWPLTDNVTGEPVVLTKDNADRFSDTTKYYIDPETKIVHRIDSAEDLVYKVDSKNTNKYLYSDPTSYDLSTGTKSETVYSAATADACAFTNKAFTELVEDDISYTYANLEVVAKKSGEEGYYPGAYWFNLDGTSYSVTKVTPITVITPSADGFDIVEMTAQEMAAKTWFVTNWTAIVNDGNKLSTIAVVAQEVANVDNKTPATSTTEGDVVYLKEGAYGLVKVDETGKTWIVYSNVEAVDLVTGESKTIYRAYNTYEGDPSNVDLTIKGDKFYVVDEEGKILKDYTATTQSGVLVAADATGAVYAKLNGSKTATDISGWDVVFLYEKDGNFVKAGDNAGVTMIDYDAYTATLDALYKTYTDAKATYNAKKSAGITGERLAYYKGLMDDAKAKYDAAVETNTAKYLDGQFWGNGSLAYYNYATYAIGTQRSAEMAFEYMVIDGTYVVFVTSFNAQ